MHAFTIDTNGLEEMMNLHRGQGLDLYWRETYTCPTEAEYTEMVMNSEFRMCHVNKYKRAANV
jgi:hypothetical protein